MLGVGWTEMLVIGVVALIVIGPRELPALMQKLGRFAGTVRRMGQDFQRELNKTTGLEEVKNLRTAITQPLKQTTDAIRREFNTTTSAGAVQPSGALKPADPKAESVVGEIHKAAGIAPPAEPAMAAAVAVPVEPVKAGPVKAAAVTTVAPSTASPRATVPDLRSQVKPTRAPKAKAASTTEGTTTDRVPPAKPAPAKKPRKPKPVDSPAPVEAIAPAKKPRKRKPAAET